MNGVKGNLSAAQIVEQVWALNRVLEERHEGTQARRHEGGAEGASDLNNPPCLRAARAQSPDPLASVPPCLPERITNVVFMGMGEPMANYAAVMQAVRVLHDPKCFNIGARRITISTVGVPPKMRQLAGEELPLNLALSLHAPNEPLRKQLIPWADHFALDDILDACRYYFDQTGREITLEYILLSGVNDRPEHARQLAKLCKTMRANVNLIRYNEVESLPYLRPRSDDVLRFQQILRDAGVNTHVRKSRGRDIEAACGQLRRKEQEKREQAAQEGEPLVTLGVPSPSE
jgi:23S rRNA (adenine2503-C2)-methyltransferase